MEVILKDLYDEIKAVITVDAFKSKMSEYIAKFNEVGLPEIANDLKKTSEFYENKFSQVSTIDNMKQSQIRVLNYIENQMYFEKSGTGNRGVFIVKKITENFHLFCKSLYKDSIHGKCSDAIKNSLSKLEISNEYDVQHLMYPLVRSVFPDARIEESEDSGHHTVRKDIVIDSQDIVIELKCSRKNMTERGLSDEVAADMVHYSNKYVFFYIYDKENVIKNPIGFKKSYENKNIDGKKIFVEILQPIGL